MGGRLIDADKLVELIDDDIAAHKDGYFEDFELPPSAYGSLCALRMVREYIKALPTVEPTASTCLGCNCPKMEKLEAEPKHGHWVLESDSEPYNEYVCSVCGTRASSFIGGSEMWYCLSKPHFCPNCGSRMDGEENGR